MPDPATAAEGRTASATITEWSVALRTSGVCKAVWLVKSTSRLPMTQSTCIWSGVTHWVPSSPPPLDARSWAFATIGQKYSSRSFSSPVLISGVVG
jgi:hypothetical protein